MGWGFYLGSTMNKAARISQLKNLYVGNMTSFLLDACWEYEMCWGTSKYFQVVGTFYILKYKWNSINPQPQKNFEPW